MFSLLLKTDQFLLKFICRQGCLWKQWNMALNRILYFLNHDGHWVKPYEIGLSKNARKHSKKYSQEMLAGKRVSDEPFKLTACEYLTFFFLLFFRIWNLFYYFRAPFLYFLFPVCLARWFLIRRQALPFICLALGLCNFFNFPSPLL